MRVVVSAVVAAILASGGVAVAQIPGQPVVSRATYTIEPYAPAAPITIQGSGVRLRAEPFTTPQTQVLSSGSTGLQLTVVGIARMSDWNWYQVVLKNGQKAFIRSDLTSAPSQGAGTMAHTPAPPVIAATPTAPPVPPVYTPPPTPQPYVPPSYSAPVPIDPPPVQLTPPATVSVPPATTNRGSLDLPKPSDPPGLQSY